MAAWTAIVENVVKAPNTPVRQNAAARSPIGRATRTPNMNAPTMFTTIVARLTGWDGSSNPNPYRAADPNAPPRAMAGHTCANPAADDIGGPYAAHMDSGLTVRGVHIPEAALEWRFTGAGGPGGQHANTANTAAELRLDLNDCDQLDDRLKQRIRRRLGNRITGAGILIVQASQHRSQTRNRDQARRRMAELLDEGIRPPAKRRKPTRPTPSSARRRVEDKRRRGKLKATRQGTLPSPGDWG